MQDTHPLTFLGVLVAIGGWLFLLFGTGVSTGQYAIREVYNVHLGTIAENVIHLGYAIAIAGVIASVGTRVAHALSKIRSPDAPTGTIAHPSVIDEPEKRVDFTNLKFSRDYLNE